MPNQDAIERRAMNSMNSEGARTDMTGMIGCKRSAS